MGGKEEVGASDEDKEVAVQELRCRIGIEFRQCRLSLHLVIVGDGVRHRALGFFGRASEFVDIARNKAVTKNVTYFTGFSCTSR